MGGAKKQKVEKDPVTIAKEKLDTAFDEFEFVHPELFRPLIENLFVDPKEEREGIALKFIEQYALCITDAKNKLLNKRSELEYHVNNHEEVRKEREEDLVKTIAHIQKLDEDKIVYDQQVTEAKEATEAAKDAFEQEERNNQEQHDAYDVVQKEQKLIKDTEDKFFIQGLTEGDNISKK